MRRPVPVAFLVLILSACSLSPQGPSVEELAATMIAETAAAATPTSPPTDTPEPSPTPEPTDTPEPTPTTTSTSTETPEPTNTPTLTPSPGPVVYSDDFSADTGAWVGCDECEWRDGQLIMGPWPSADSFDAYYTLCQPCGTPSYYRMSVDATYVDGPTDRGYGLLIRLGRDRFLDLEITTFQTATLWEYDIHTRAWRFVDGRFTGLLNASYATNTLEVEVRPSSGGRADLFINLNGHNWTVLFGQPADPVEVGLLVGLHSIAVAFDKFEFEEIEP